MAADTDQVVAVVEAEIWQDGDRILRRGCVLEDGGQLPSSSRRTDYYNGTTFHRVAIPGSFMIQGGDPNSKSGDRSTHGTGGPATRSRRRSSRSTNAAR